MTINRTEVERQQEALKRMFYIHKRRRFTIRVEQKGAWFVAMLWDADPQPIGARQSMHPESIAYYKGLTRMEAVTECLMSRAAELVAYEDAFRANGGAYL